MSRDDDEPDEVDDELDLLTDDDLDDGDDGAVEGDEVVYDLAEWTLAQRSELQTHLVSHGVAHAWVAAELSVKVADEGLTDELVAAVDEDRAPNVESVQHSGEELVFELDDWDDEQRAALAMRLEAMGVPYAFEDDESLVVPVAWEAAVEELLDEVEFPDALAVEDDDGEARSAVVDDDDEDLDDDDEDLDDEDVDDEDLDDDEGDDRGPVITDDDAPSAPGEVLSELFLAADRLLHDTGDVAGLDGLATSLDTMEGAGPPYGVDPNLWARLGTEAGALADHLTDGEEELAVERATTLRTLLRPFV